MTNGIYTDHSHSSQKESNRELGFRADAAHVCELKSASLTRVVFSFARVFMSEKPRKYGFESATRTGKLLGSTSILDEQYSKAETTLHIPKLPTRSCPAQALHLEE